MTTNYQPNILENLNSKLNSNHPISSTLPNHTQLDVASSSPRKMIYLFINSMDFQSSMEIIDCVYDFIKPNVENNTKKFNITSLPIDQTPIPEDIRHEFKWLCSYYNINTFPKDNFISMQNVGLNRAGLDEMLIFVDEEYLPIIKVAIDNARIRAKGLQDGSISGGFRKGAPSISLVECDFEDTNILLKYHTKWGIPYPNLDLFQNPSKHNIAISPLQKQLVEEFNNN
jgi:hypothetical protein